MFPFINKFSLISLASFIIAPISLLGQGSPHYIPNPYQQPSFTPNGSNSSSGGISNPLTGNLDAGGNLITNAPNIVYTNGNAGVAQNIYQTPVFVNGLTTTNSSLIQQVSPGAGFNMYWNSGHSIEAEEQMAATGSLSFTLGTDQTKLGVLQLTGSGPYDVPVLFQYDTSTNLLGWSTAAIFGFKSGQTTNSLTNHYWGISAIGTSTTTGQSILKFYSSWAGGDTLFAGAQVDPLGNVVAGTMTSSNLTWRNIIGTNGGIFGGTNLLAGDFTTASFVIEDPLDTNATSSPFQFVPGTTSDTIYIGKQAVSGTRQTVVQWRNNSGGIMMSTDPINSRVYITSGYQMAIGGTTPTNTLDVNGGISTSTLVVTNAASFGSFKLGASTNISSFTVVNTNWISAQLYTNTTGRIMDVRGNAVLTTAAVVGVSQLALQSAGNLTNYATVITAIGGIAGNMTNAITPALITNNGTFVFTNTSSGVGNTATVLGGQYIVY